MNTGMIRRVDELGRVVIPIEIRNSLDIKERDPMEFHVENRKLILEKYEQGCIFCDSKDDLKEINGKMICKKCVSKIQELD